MPTVVELHRRSSHWRRDLSLGGAVLVGLAAIGFAALWPAYLYGIDTKMQPSCPTGVRASLVGLDVAVTVVAFAAIHLARRVLVRDASQAIAMTRRLWIGAASLWIGTMFYAGYVASHTGWSGVFDGWCHL
jgi:hypothetical protein